MLMLNGNNIKGGGTMTFRKAVCNELKDCKSANEIAKRSFELMQIIADVSWEANAVRETDAEGDNYGG